MSFNQSFGYGQPQSEAAEPRGDIFILLLEGFENTCERGWINSTSLVGHRYGDRIVSGLRSPDLDGAAFRAELNGIVQEIPEHLLKPG